MDDAPLSLLDRLRSRALETPQHIAYLYRHPGSSERWDTLSWGQVLARVEAMSAALADLGLRDGDRAAIMMPTSPDWEICQFAAMAVGCAVIGLDLHDAPRNLRHILEATRPRIIFTTDPGQLERIAECWHAPELAVISSGEAKTSGTHLLATLLATASVLEKSRSPQPDQVATIVFTSGSTGQPKGIAYTHRQIISASDLILERFPDIRSDARLVCWLPLSNLFQRMVNFCAMRRGAASYFIADPHTIASVLPQTEPTFFIGVPRFFEKLHAGIVREIESKPLPLRVLLETSWAIGMRAARARRERRSADMLTRALLPLADRVLARIRAVMGRNLQFMVSGSAPLPVWLAERLHGLGWLVLEAYGISENVAPIAMNTPDDFRFGSVGHVLPGNELRIADDGELLVRGPCVFGGYYEGTDEGSPIDAEGFLHTGDYARIDDAGYLWLEGRKSDVFKTSTGHRIAPAPIEGALRSIPGVEHAVVIGHDRPYPVAILALAAHSLQGAGGERAVLERIAADVVATCGIFPPYQRPGALIVTFRPFSIETGELTANLKIRRRPVELGFRTQIDEAYSRPASRTERGATTALPVITSS